MSFFPPVLNTIHLQFMFSIQFGALMLNPLEAEDYIHSDVLQGVANLGDINTPASWMKYYLYIIQLQSSNAG